LTARATGLFVLQLPGVDHSPPVHVRWPITHRASETNRHTYSKTHAIHGASKTATQLTFTKSVRPRELLQKI